MERFELIPVIDEGLGNSTYLLALDDGRAAVIDPERDLRQVRTEAQRRRLRIAWAVETHLHADFISGARELAATEGAVVLAPEVGPRGFETTALSDGATVELGNLVIEALHTPGHSPEHLSYLLHDGGRLAGVFTGGSLMVGTAGRTDLVSPDQTIPLAHAQYHSLQRLMELPDQTPVWPTHGAGSFCSAATGTRRVSTIGAERATNPLLQVDGEDALVQALLDSLGTFPDYFLRLGAVNHQGPAVLGDTPPLPALTAAEVRELIADGGQLVDVRPAAQFAAGHIPGSLSITLRTVFSTWLGWLTDPNRPVIVVRSADQSSDDIVWGAANVGIDQLAGELADGIEAWPADELTTGTAMVDPEQLTDDPPAAVLDVRQHGEYTTGHLPAARNIELGALPEVDAVPAGPVLVMCAHGERGMTAASLLERAGHTDIRVLKGGPEDWARATGDELEATA